MKYKIYDLMNRGDTIGYFFQVLPITVIITLIYVTYRIVKSKRNKHSVDLIQEVIMVIFVCYTVGLFNLILTPRDLWLHVYSSIFFWHGFTSHDLSGAGFNLVPIIIKLKSDGYIMGTWVLKMLILNALMFVPLGFLTPMICKIRKRSEMIKNRHFVLFSLLIPLAIEIIQPIIGRSFDTDDIITNFLGIMLGFFLFGILENILNKNQSR